MKHLATCLTVLVLFFGAERLEAVTIDFESAPLGIAPSYSENGVLFTAEDGTGIDIRNFSGDNGLLSADIPFKPILAQISGGAIFVSAVIGDLSPDQDNIFLRGFDASDVLVAQDTAFLPGAGSTTLSISDPDIDHVIYGSNSTLNGSSVAATIFEFEPVPEPSALSLFGLSILGLVSCGWRRWKRAL